MGMSTHVIGFRPPDETWRKMKAIWDACAEADVAPPAEVEKFFGYEPPDETGVEVSLQNSPAVQKWSDDSRWGYEIDIAKLDPTVKVIRVYNAC